MIEVLSKEETWKIEERMFPAHIIAMEVETVLRQAKAYRELNE